MSRGRPWRSQIAAPPRREVPANDGGGGAEVFDAGVGLQEPMKAAVDGDLLVGVPALRSMYSRARSKAFLSASLALGSGN